MRSTSNNGKKNRRRGADDGKSLYEVPIEWSVAPKTAQVNTEDVGGWPH